MCVCVCVNWKRREVDGIPWSIVLSMPLDCPPPPPPPVLPCWPPPPDMSFMASCSMLSIVGEVGGSGGVLGCMCDWERCLEEGWVVEWLMEVESGC